MLVVQSVAEQVRETLTRAIIEGELLPNAVLSDRQLSEQLGVSRTPIREAFHQLESSGLLRRRSRVGWVVADLKRKDVEELIELRTILEVAGVQRVVKWPEAELAALAASFDVFAQPLDPAAYAAYLQQDRAFHNTLVKATDNSRIVEVYRVVEWQIDRIRHLVSYRVQNRVDHSFKEHRRICAALASRDAPGAVAALEGHFSNVQKKFVELLEANAGSFGSRSQVEASGLLGRPDAATQSP
ncbi:GntR family transcriptional regulator [Salinarimonas rosea]|uniref:GntR family transcriptional regulator n=1 Tax=Salinarimonas rosea TaxID=552063 RepID=UPI00048BEB1A|nr:GntR family transcriptional regulator [Salinarimonas rosea]